MWTYIVRRLLLMIPTLFGVTLVTFTVMQLAPGDPLLDKLGTSGTAGASTQTRESHVLMKRELKLDRPWFLNDRYYTDFSEPIRIAAYYRSLNVGQIAAELERIAENPEDPELARRKKFLKTIRVDKGMRIERFEERLDPPRLTDEELKKSRMTREQADQQRAEKRLALALAIDSFVMVWCENLGQHGVKPSLNLLQSSDADLREKIGAVKVLQLQVLSPFQYTFTRAEDPAELVRVHDTWRILWQREASKFEPVDPERAADVRRAVVRLADSGTRSEIFEYIENIKQDAEKFFPEDAPVFADILLGDHPLPEQAIAAEALRLYVSARVEVDVPLDAAPADVARVAKNWEVYFTSHQADYEVSWQKRLWSVLTDTQYASMTWRLVTFNFGRTAEKTPEPVAKKIYEGAATSLPLMLMAELLIYGIAIPLGILCAVNRGKLFDRFVQLGLFLLNSIPAFVAGMLLLVCLSYGHFVKWFPMEKLHDDNAQEMGFVAYLIDYFWHATLPAICLSLFSLAGMAMYARTSMLDVLGQDYIRTARAKGLSGFHVIMKHAFRNSLITIITLFASFLPALLGGSVLVEHLFNIKGMGKLSLVAIFNKDYPTIMALVYIDAIVVMVSILLTDLLYVIADPRISFDGQDGSV